MTQQNRKMYIFDFDDTLVKSNCKVIVRNPRAPDLELTSAEYAIYRKRPGDEFDFSQFERIPNPKFIRKNIRTMLHAYQDGGPKSVAILTARSPAAQRAIRNFLNKLGMMGVEIITTGSSDPLAKASQIERWIIDNDLDSVEFYDDSEKNINAVEDIAMSFPGVRINTHLVVERINKLGLLIHRRN
jgi:hypothetical protein